METEEEERRKMLEDSAQGEAGEGKVLAVAQRAFLPGGADLVAPSPHD